MINRAIHQSNGLYSDEWAAPLLRYMLPPSPGPIIIEGSLREESFDAPTVISIEVNGQAIGMYIVSRGDFRLACAPRGSSESVDSLRNPGFRVYRCRAFSLRGIAGV